MAGLLILGAALILGWSLAKQPKLARRIGDILGRIRPWQLVLMAGLVLAFAIEPSRFVVLAAVIALAIVFGLEWAREFRYLMSLNDSAFPGRQDKLIWATLMIVLPPVGLWMFRNHRLAHWPSAKVVKGFAFHDLF